MCDDDNFICECGEDRFEILITIDNHAMCENCLQKLINKLRKEANYGKRKKENRSHS